MLHSLSDELNVSDFIDWIDLLPQIELRRIYNDIDYFIFPSELNESLGLVALEAMACGTPVIGSDYAAQSFYINDGVNGYKFKVGDAEAMKKTIVRAKEIIDYYPVKYESLCNGACETAKQYYENNQRIKLKEILAVREE